jgi:hypothetical protein
MAHDMLSIPGNTEIISFITVIAVSLCSALGTNFKMANSHPANAPSIPHPAFLRYT